MNIAQLRARYEPGTFLGRGAHASVYHARDRATGALVGVKRIIAATSDGRRRNAVRGAYVMKQLSEQCQHPNALRAIIVVIDVEFQTVYLAMELCSGG
ncbi:hypothetical protein M885DRAFT_543626 [Pelagophyceae sp. CCMP2097]|nr:hypothetical protein M885DRAFT_543626 [Pelagophyceae sp. CCMP2097]|mmetsp:Transcript_23676/g.79891  ORF Transcript_23676/g.79891 Transcript_23676/m.79891 type:complete len:98 (+) Transcript_23676:525-818(+)